MKRSTLIIIIIIVAIGGFVLLNNSDTKEVVISDAEVTLNQINIVLSEQNESGESGIVTLAEVNGQVTVSLNLVGAPNTVQPAHIHNGSCDNLGGVQNPLTFPINGISATILDVTMSDLLSGLPLAINVHKSPEEAGVYVACGDIIQ